MVEIGRTYPQGNLNSKTDEAITIDSDPEIQYFRVVGNESILMEYDPRTRESKRINIPQF